MSFVSFRSFQKIAEVLISFQKADQTLKNQNRFTFYIPRIKRRRPSNSHGFTIRLTVSGVISRSHGLTSKSHSENKWLRSDQIRSEIKPVLPSVLACKSYLSRSNVGTRRCLTSKTCPLGKLLTRYSQTLRRQTKYTMMTKTK